MKVEKCDLEGLYVFTPSIFSDERGHFYESFNMKVFENLNIETSFVQDNESFSRKNTIRGLHFQKGSSAQAKLVRCSKGEVYDVAVDLRVGSPTFGRWYGVVLSEENKKQLFIPRGFAHGFSVLSETAIFNYKCDNYYDQASESGIYYADPLLSIDWRVEKPVVSSKDMSLSELKNIKRFDLFNYSAGREKLKTPSLEI